MPDSLQHTLTLIDGPAAGPEPGRCEVNRDAADVELLDAYSRAVITVVDTVAPAVVSITVGKPTPTDGAEGSASDVDTDLIKHFIINKL